MIFDMICSLWWQKPSIASTYDFHEHNKSKWFLDKWLYMGNFYLGNPYIGMQRFA